MKKITALFLTALMVAALTGCAVPGLDGNSPSRTPEEILSGGDSTASIDYDSKDSDTYTEPEAGYPNEYGYAEGTIGDTMHTVFFEYTVNSAYLCDEYEGYEPSEGYVFLVADVTVHNPYKNTVPMYDMDFQIQWGEEDAFDYPITAYMEEDETINGDMLPKKYDVRRFESRTGILVYEVPEGETYFSIAYLEVYDDDSEGNAFFVDFSADYK